MNSETWSHDMIIVALNASALDSDDATIIKNLRAHWRGEVIDGANSS